MNRYVINITSTPISTISDVMCSLQLKIRDNLTGKIVYEDERKIRAEWSEHKYEGLKSELEKIAFKVIASLRHSYVKKYKAQAEIMIYDEGSYAREKFEIYRSTSIKALRALLKMIYQTDYKDYEIFNVRVSEVLNDNP